MRSFELDSLEASCNTKRRPEDIAIHRLEWDIPIYIWQLNEYNFLKFAQVKRPFYDHLRGRDLGRLIKTRYFTVELIVEGNVYVCLLLLLL